MNTILHNHAHLITIAVVLAIALLLTLYFVQGGHVPPISISPTPDSPRP